MKNRTNRILLALTILTALSFLGIMISGSFNWISLDRFWSNLLFHLPIMTFLFWQLYACRTGVRQLTQRLPLLIAAGGAGLGIAFMFLLSYIPLLGFLILLFSVMHILGSAVGLIVYHLHQHITLRIMKS